MILRRGSVFFGGGVSTVKNVIDELISRKFIIVTDNGRRLINHKSLLELNDFCARNKNY